GIGTTTPGRTLTVVGDIRATGILYDSTNSAGTNGMVLQTSGTSYTWVATSTLGISGGSGVSASGTAGNIQFYGSSSALNANRLFTWDNTNGRMSIGTTGAVSALQIENAITSTGANAIAGLY